MKRPGKTGRRLRGLRQPAAAAAEAACCEAVRSQFRQAAAPPGFKLRAVPQQAAALGAPSVAAASSIKVLEEEP
ncbi:MAG: hypothetical protein ACKV19_28670, partial [Verrucomicrobiales bacterium]